MKMKRLALSVVVVAAAVSAWAQAEVPALENEDKAYGALQERIVARIRLWPGLAPHETECSRGRFAYDAKRKVWRRYDVSCPELVILRPTGTPRDTLVVVMPGGGYQTQHTGHICRDSKPILDSGRWVAVLHYRIPRRVGRNIYDAPREDARWPFQASGIVVWPPMSGGNSRRIVPYLRNACAIMRWRRSSRLNCDADEIPDRKALMAR